ncbi:Zn-dependent hydrolase [Rugosimonospora africana]|uniref:Zn-dependent hydrolase n=1 Tax=Rugosimonospora africana TaxID=556532 RepID=A0A8J3VWD4_9ACTN|nr:Zn-dependent hydrolase [Rugosimonospora africana]GIH21205.1 Zn-dependent hydrolase [Rugosimonospora africana]
MVLHIDAARMRDDLATLAGIGRTEAGGISRTAFSAADALARQWYRDRCVAAGLDLRVDGLGNMFARAPGADTGLPAVWSGSHIDTVPNGGPLDGALGTVAALECVRRLAELGVPLARPVCAVVFSDEEGNYGHLLGSRGLVQGYELAALEAMTGRDGDRLMDALASWTWAQGEPTATRVSAGSVHSFVELHIEQGPHLEAAGTEIGVVTSIVGLGGAVVEFTGRADHAGTTPMTMRRDALLAAGDYLTRLPGVAASVGQQSVVTCGLIRVEPGGANVVPGRAHVTLDFRDPDRNRLIALGRALRDAAEASAEAHGVGVLWHGADIVDPVPLDQTIRSAVQAASDALGLRSVAIASGAGHDSQNMAHLAPTGMIFVPSKDGRSHSPAEDTDWADLERGADVLLNTLYALATC